MAMTASAAPMVQTPGSAKRMPLESSTSPVADSYQGAALIECHNTCMGVWSPIRVSSWLGISSDIWAGKSFAAP